MTAIEVDTDAFTRDWLAGTLVRDMADRYGMHPNTITATVARLGLPDGRSAERRDARRAQPHALPEGQWVPGRGGVRVWRPA